MFHDISWIKCSSSGREGQFSLQGSSWGIRFLRGSGACCSHVCPFFGVQFLSGSSYSSCSCVSFICRRILGRLGCVVVLLLFGFRCG